MCVCVSTDSLSLFWCPSFVRCDVSAVPPWGWGTELQTLCAAKAAYPFKKATRTSVLEYNYVIKFIYSSTRRRVNPNRLSIFSDDFTHLQSCLWLLFIKSFLESGLILRSVWSEPLTNSVHVKAFSKDTVFDGWLHIVRRRYKTRPGDMLSGGWL